MSDATVAILELTNQFVAEPNDSCPFIAWIYVRSLSVLRRKYRQAWSRHGLAAQIPFDPDWFLKIPDPRTLEEPEGMDPDERQLLRLAVGSLPEKQRDVLSALFFGRKTQEQVAAERGISQPAVSKLASRGIARLRRTLCGDSRSDIHPGY